VKPGSRYRLTDVLWWTRRDDVFRRIATILDIPTANTSTPGWFQLRTKASKDIILEMSQEDKKVLEDDADRMEREGFPEDVQRRYVEHTGRWWPVVAGNGRHKQCLNHRVHRIAEGKWYSRLSAGASKNYKEMGLVQLSICVYKGKTGNINVNM
jgi:hypothetical protein